MATTQNTFTGDGSNLGPFSFTFKWLESTDIKVTVAGVLKTAGTHYNLQGLNYTTKTGGQVLFTAGNAPANGAAIVVYRQTDDSDLAATFYSGSAIRAQDLNNNFIQGLYVTQESSNNAAAATATANAATTTANTALSNSTAAQASAASAISTANSAVSIANSAVSTANSAVSTANSASAAAASAVSTANTANSTASSALSAVSEALAYTTVANVAAIPGSPTNGDSLRITNSTGIESFTPLIGVPVGFVGNSELTVEIYYNGTSSTWVWSRYFPSDPETRYLKLAGGTLTGDLTVANQGDIRLSEATANGSNYVAIQAPSSLAANVTYTLPSADGTSGQLLSTNGSGTLSWATTSNDIIQEGNSSAEVIDTGSDGRFVVTTEGTERVRVDSSGRLLVRTSSTYTDVIAGGGGYSGPLWIASTGTANCGQFISSWSSDAAVDPYGASIVLSRSKNGTIGSHTALASGNAIGTISFNGSDGSKFVSGAVIKAEIDGGVSTSDLPSRLVFSTTADGASSPTERMRIRNDGSTSLYSSTSVIELRSAAAAGGALEILNGYHSATSTSTGTRSVLIATNGNIQNTNNSYAGISDVKLKENIVDAGSQWDDLRALQVRKYNFKEETGHQTFTQIGLIAQEVELVSPGLVNESPDRDAEGNDLGTVTKSVNYSVLYMKAVKALQEAMERIETLEAKVAALESPVTVPEIPADALTTDI